MTPAEALLPSWVRDALIILVPILQGAIVAYGVTWATNLRPRFDALPAEVKRGLVIGANYGLARIATALGINIPANVGDVSPETLSTILGSGFSLLLHTDRKRRETAASVQAVVADVQNLDVTVENLDVALLKNEQATEHIAEKTGVTLPPAPL